MGMLLVIVGLGWALLGVFNLTEGIQQLDKQGFGDTAKGFALVFNMAILILPGLGLAGIGQSLRRRRRKKTEMPPEASATDTIACPFCAETIKRAASICRFCQRPLA